MFLLPPQTPPPDPDPLLARVVANVAQYKATLPSITTDEDITSSLRQHGLYRANDKAHATLHVAAGKPGEALHETRTYVTLNGKPVSPGTKVSVTFELNGRFSRIAETFFTTAHLPCYTFTRLPQPASDGSIQLTFATSTTLPAGCKNTGITLTGLVLLEPVTAQIRHLERTLLSSSPAVQHSVTFIALDYAPARLGEQTIWLPTTLNAELDHGKGRFAARYSGYHRYTGTATILPASEPPAEDQP